MAVSTNAGEGGAGIGGIINAAQSGSCIWHPQVIVRPEIVQSVSGISSPSAGPLASSLFQFGPTLDVGLQVTGFVSSLIILILAFLSLGSNGRRTILYGSLVIIFAGIAFGVLGSDFLLGILIALAGGVLMIRRGLGLP